MKKTKIVCTIGPACEDVATLRNMAQSGMNVARLNFSHGTHESHAAIIERVRSVSLELNMPIAILQDLQGPKVRVAELSQPLTITVGQEVIIGKDFNLSFDIFDSVKVDERISLGDGTIELMITKKSGSLIYCKAITAGVISSHKSVNIPDSTLLFPSITEKDIDDLRFGLAHDVDAIAVSFVRSAKDILTVRDIIKTEANTEPLIIAKIEKKEAIDCLDEIIAVADGIMVARGDLGVEMPEEEITLLQKMIVEKCRRAGKPVIVATEMLDSMTRQIKPTRAEVSDVSNAVIDSADCVMLSGETATGKYPIQTVKEMAAIIETVEASAFAEDISDKLSEAEFGREGVGAFSKSLEASARAFGAKVLTGVVETFTQATAISQGRPRLPIALFTNNKKLWNKLSFVWGIEEFFIQEISRAENSGSDALASDQSEKTKTASQIKTVLVSAGVIDSADTIFIID